MADNAEVDSGTGLKVATDKVTYSGDADENLQLMRPAHVVGTEGSKTVEAVTGTTAAAVPPAAVFVGGTDGTNVRALKTDTGGELQVDVLTLPNVTLAAGTNTNEVVGDAAHDAAVSGNPVLIGGYASAAAPTDVGADGRAVRAWSLRNGARAVAVTAAGALIGGDATNGLDVDVTRLPALVAGTANIGDVDVLTVPAVAGEAASTMNASSSDGATALTNSAQVIKASAGTLKGYYIYNPNTTTAYVQFYNTAAASVTVGTTNPLFMLAIPPQAAANLWCQPGGITFSNAGWSWAATSTAGGNGAPSTALDAVAWYA